MNKKGIMLVWKIYLYIVNPRTLTNLILPLSLISKNFFAVDKIDVSAYLVH